MGYTEEERERIFNKSNGRCRHCGIQLAFDNYGDRNARGGWEVDHSKPVAKGGKDHFNNFWALCWRCNLEKGDRHGSSFDDDFEPKSWGGKIVEGLGLGKAGDFGTDPHRIPKK